eukprot:TRINITY_DN88110_c0_g1_i1.p1 TRINITY_DN88110_c0_g1~~TRINITY_DN88110_c0_g1_i1.p1  ORF type:complete len:149 (+),score=38.79 TRINITY_DN88110_c0_g1_i1:72-518(+)
MTASLVRSVLGAGARTTLALRTGTVYQTWTRTAFFRRQKDKEEDAQSVDTPEEKQLAASSSVMAAANNLRKREGLQTVRGYKPPTDVESRVESVVSHVCGEVKDVSSVKLDNRIKFKVTCRSLLSMTCDVLLHWLEGSDVVRPGGFWL